MKLTKEVLKKMIKETLEETYVTDIAGSDEDREIDRHRARKRARGEYPPRPAGMGGYEDPRSQEQRDADRMGALVQATRNILNMAPGISLMVDANTYAAIEAMAPELLDRVSTRG